jgi:metal-responsive CopG/Arc/MetJ family transcriptional regulator
VKNSHITSSGKAKISINVPEKLLLELDEHRTLVNLDRSIWITSAIMEKLANIKLQKKKDEFKNNEQ